MTVGFTPRALAALHEAGHAVVALAVGWPFRYATLRPRTAGHGGELRATRAGLKQQRDGWWLPPLAAASAGMVVDEVWLSMWRHVHAYGATRDELRSRHVIRAGSEDLRMIRDGARFAWHQAQLQSREPSLWPAPRPALGANDTVRSIAARAWEYAAQIAFAHWGLIHTVAQELHDGNRALTRADVQAISDYTGPRPADRQPEPGELEFWPERYSRLAWAPEGGRCAVADNAATDCDACGTPPMLDVPRVPAPEPEHLSPDRRRTIRQANAIALGCHPLGLALGATVWFHPDAAPGDDRAAAGLRCGTCAHRVLFNSHAARSRRISWCTTR